jgi:peptide/nickel transport system ATP-binding protein
VMYLGKLCEVGPADDIYSAPLHPYTAALLASIPNPDPTQPRVRTDEKIGGEPPSPIDPPTGCRFHTRCPFAQERCRVEEPRMRSFGPGHTVACHFPLQQVADQVS